MSRTVLPRVIVPFAARALMPLAARITAGLFSAATASLPSSSSASADVPSSSVGAFGSSFSAGTDEFSSSAGASGCSLPDCSSSAPPGAGTGSSSGVGVLPVSSASFGARQSSGCASSAPQTGQSGFMTPSVQAVSQMHGETSSPLSSSFANAVVGIRVRHRANAVSKLRNLLFIVIPP